MRSIVGGLGLFLLLVLALPASPIAGAVHAEARKGQGMMEHKATGSFDVQLTPVPAADSPIGGMAIAKTFHGDLDATSVGQMLAFRTAVPGSAGYVAMERVTGTLAGKQGSFTLQHSGSMARGASSLSVTVVPDSASGGLEGLEGSMTIDIVGGRHDYTFVYSLPE